MKEAADGLIAGRLKALRTLRGMTLERLAAATGFIYLPRSEGHDASGLAESAPRSARDRRAHPSARTQRD